MKKPLVSLMAFLVFLPLALSHSPSSAANFYQQTLEWTSVSSPTGNHLRGVSFVSSADGWAVGNQGTILHWDGTEWSTATSPTSADLYAVDMVSSTDGWAVGNDGVILHWDGSSWSQATSPVAFYLRDVDMLSPSDGWIVGFGGTLLHWDGSSWIQASAPYLPFIDSIEMISSNEGWAVGEQGGGAGVTSLHWDGSSWWEVTMPSGTSTLLSISMISPTDGWAGGLNGSMLHWDGTSWTVAPYPSGVYIADIDMVSSTDGWAVGGEFVHWDGNSWVLVSTSFSGTLYDVEMTSGVEGWAVGASGSILQYGVSQYVDLRQAGEIQISGDLVEGSTVYLTIPVHNYGTAPSPPIHPYTEGYTSLGDLWRTDGAQPTAHSIQPGESVDFQVEHELWYGHTGTWTINGVFLWDHSTNTYLGALESNGYNQTISFDVSPSNPTPTPSPTVTPSTTPTPTPDLPQTLLVSLRGDGIQGDSWSMWPAISEDGRYVTFASNSYNLFPFYVGANQLPGVFLKDMLTGELTLISVALDGGASNGGAGSPDISRDGRYVAFLAGASDIVPIDNNNLWDVFLYDRISQTTQLISLRHDGTQLESSHSYGIWSFALSPDAEFVVLGTNSQRMLPDQVFQNPRTDLLYVRELETGFVDLITYSYIDGGTPNRSSGGADIAEGGRYVTFWSSASNLVKNDFNGTALDVFLHDRQTGETQLLMPPDFKGMSNASGYDTAISADGKYVVIAVGQAQPDPIGGIYLYSVETDEYKLISRGLDGVSAIGQGVSISPTGRYVTFSSEATNLVPGDDNNLWDVFRYDTESQTITLVSLSNDGSQANGQSRIVYPTDSNRLNVSTTGEFVVFPSDATNLVLNDSNEARDVFLRQLAGEPIPPPVPNPTEIMGRISIGSLPIAEAVVELLVLIENNYLVVDRDITNTAGEYRFPTDDENSTYYGLDLNPGEYFVRIQLRHDRFESDGTLQTVLQIRFGICDVANSQCPDEPKDVSARATYPIQAFPGETTVFDVIFGLTHLSPSVGIPEDHLLDIARIYANSMRVLLYTRDILGVHHNYKLPINVNTFALPMAIDIDAGTVFERNYYIWEEGYEFAGDVFLADYSILQYSSLQSSRHHNAEWHELFHELMDETIGAPSEEKLNNPPQGEETQINHGGLCNPTTADSWFEGWPTFWVVQLAEHEEWKDPSCGSGEYRLGEACINIEINYTPIDASSSGGPGPVDPYAEEFAIAGILYDLVDPIDPDDGEYGDHVYMDLATEFWPYLDLMSGWFKATNEGRSFQNMHDVYLALSLGNHPKLSYTPELGAANALERVFLNHGFIDGFSPVLIAIGPDQNDCNGDSVIPANPERPSFPILEDALLHLEISEEDGDPVEAGFLQVTIQDIQAVYDDIVYEVDIAELGDGELFLYPPQARNPSMISITAFSTTGVQTDTFVMDNHFFWERFWDPQVEYIAEHTFVIGASEETTRIVTIDIKPDDYPNVVNCKNDRGILTVALLSTEWFDATSLDHTTIEFMGTIETHINSKTGEPKLHEEDIDGDGDIDLVFHFRLGETSLTCNSTIGTLTGFTNEGIQIVGTDSIEMNNPSSRASGKK